ncbi:crAss001_48 related protein, partial [Streptococcus pneumoniae]
NKLSLMISNYYVGTLDFKLKCPIELLETQHYTMCAYLKILEQRAEIENIEF